MTQQEVAIVKQALEAYYKTYTREQVIESVNYVRNQIGSYSTATAQFLNQWHENLSYEEAIVLLLDNNRIIGFSTFAEWYVKKRTGAIHAL